MLSNALEISTAATALQRSGQNISLYRSKFLGVHIQAHCNCVLVDHPSEVETYFTKDVSFDRGWFRFRVVRKNFVVFKLDRKSTRLNSSHVSSSYAVCCLQK